MRDAKCEQPTLFWESFVTGGWPGATAKPWSSANTAMRPFIESGPHGVGSSNRSLESCLRSKDSRAVRRGAVGKVPAKATRRWPTLLHARFCSSGEESDFLIDCNRTRPLLRFCVNLKVCIWGLAAEDGRQPASDETAHVSDEGRPKSVNTTQLDYGGPLAYQ